MQAHLDIYAVAPSLNMVSERNYMFTSEFTLSFTDHWILVASLVDFSATIDGTCE